MIKNFIISSLLLTLVSCNSYKSITLYKEMALDEVAECYREAENDRVKLKSLSLKKHKRCLKMAEDFDSSYYISANLNSLGAIEYSKLNYKKALDYYQKSLEVAEENGIRMQKTIVLNNIFAVYLNQRYNGKSADGLEQAIALSLEIESYQRINPILMNFRLLSKRTNYKRMCETINLIAQNPQAYNMMDQQYKDIYAQQCE